MLLLAHPLHAHRPAGKADGDQRRIGGGVVGAVVAVAARAFHVDAAHLLGRQAEHLGDRAAQRDRRPGCASRPSAAVLEQRDGAGRADRAVHLVGTAVGRLELGRATGGRAWRPATTMPALRRQALAGARRGRPASGRVARAPPSVRAAASARIAVTAWYSRSATTARKLPSRTTFRTPGIRFDRGASSTDFRRAP